MGLNPSFSMLYHQDIDLNLLFLTQRGAKIFFLKLDVYFKFAKAFHSAKITNVNFSYN
jgi:hypothetical protein